MKNYGKVRSTVKPESMVIDEFSVWENENITEIEVPNEMPSEDGKITTHIEYEYEMKQYSKDEFIMKQAQVNIDTQLALCEIYEGMGV